MPEIRAVEAILFTYALAPGRELLWAGGTISERASVLVRIADDARRVGWGEISEVYLLPKIYVELVNGRVAGALVGRDPSDIEGIHHDLQVLLVSLGRGGVSSAVVSSVDLALHNLRAELLPAPVELPVYASVGFHPDVARMCAECREALAAGFRNLKIRGGFSVDEDLKRVRAARECIGPAAGLALELSQPYARRPYSFDEVLRLAQSAEEHRLLWLEEPFAADDLGSYRRLKEKTSVPLAAGENLYTEEEFRRFAPALDVLQPDIARMGGITSLARIAQYSTRIAFHQFGTSVALATAARVASTLPNFYMLEMDLLPHPLRDRIFPGGLTCRDGRLLLPPFDFAALADVASPPGSPDPYPQGGPCP
ncbi:MAG: mandelate racemase/muconate lactonizing enzyme family protein [Planctomycetota bacterium]